jgi:FKBP-type peptidyl-prolyl cis-trans isomerase SlyD
MAKESNMLIARNSVVTLSYNVKDTDGNVIDSGAGPLVYLHGGYGGIFDRIEEAIQGKTTGDSLEIKLQPEDAFGEYDAERIIIEPRNLFPEDIEVGTQFERGDEDERLYTITDITEDKVVVDGNHPLAGMALIFSCTVTDVREGTAEEISHGHVHGAHGHHH